MQRQLLTKSLIPFSSRWTESPCSSPSILLFPGFYYPNKPLPLHSRDLVRVFASLREAVKKKWPEDEVVPYTAVSGFIFLRLFVAAILSPNLFGLWGGSASLAVSLCYCYEIQDPLSLSLFQQFRDSISKGEQEPNHCCENRSEHRQLSSFWTKRRIYERNE